MFRSPTVFSVLRLTLTIFLKVFLRHSSLVQGLCTRPSLYIPQFFCLSVKSWYLYIFSFKNRFLTHFSWLATTNLGILVRWLVIISTFSKPFFCFQTQFMTCKKKKSSSYLLFLFHRLVNFFSILSNLDFYIKDIHVMSM